MDNMEAVAIVTALAGEAEPVYMTGMGDEECVFCGPLILNGSRHTDSCLWERAKRAVAAPETGLKVPEKRP